MTGPPSSSYPGQVPPPAAVISQENRREKLGFAQNIVGFVLRRPAAIFGDQGCLIFELDFGRISRGDSGHFRHPRAAGACGGAWARKMDRLEVLKSSPGSHERVGVLGSHFGQAQCEVARVFGLAGVLTGPIRGRVEILGNVQFTGETLPKFWQKVSCPKSSLVKEDIVLRSKPGVSVMPGSLQGSSRVPGNSGRVLSSILADGIYPRWTTFVKSIPHPRSHKENFVAAYQEGYRKDVERCFGILQARWAIIRGAARLFDEEVLRSIMMTCIILHNMIVEDEYDYNAAEDEYEPDPMNTALTRIYEKPMRPNGELVQHDPLVIDNSFMHRMIERYTEMQSSYIHEHRQMDLMEHLWVVKGNEGQ
ncbi:unnamed protein product [Prunus armeniaca]